MPFVELTETRTAPRAAIAALDGDWPELATEAGMTPPPLGPPSTVATPPAAAPPAKAAKPPGSSLQRPLTPTASVPLTTPARVSPFDSFGLDDAAGKAARDAFTPGTRRSPLASTGFDPGGHGGRPAPTAKAGMPLATGEPLDEDESTRAVQREELDPPASTKNEPSGNYVVQGDAVGDEATLAVAPGQNLANMQRFAGMEPPTSKVHQVLPMTGSPQPAPAPAKGWERQTHAMSQPHARPPASNPMMPAAVPPSSGNVPAAPPHMPGAGPHHGQMPMGAVGYPAQPYPANVPVQGSQGAWDSHAPREAQPAGGTSPILSKQIIVLIVVGVLCLAIFITGIVLFASTKF
jgi:hypothetical protein